eukprot:11383176-Ditylum_brightwellii.AAC.1
MEPLWQMKYMKGHQQGGNFPRQAGLNNKVGELSTLARESLPWKKCFVAPLIYPTSNILVTIQNKMITQNLSKEIQQVFMSRKLREHME